MADINTHAASVANYPSNAANRFNMDKSAASKHLNSSRTQTTSHIHKANSVIKSTQATSNQKADESFRKALKKAHSQDSSQNIKATGYARDNNRVGSYEPFSGANSLSNNLVQPGSNLAKQGYRGSTNAINDASFRRLKNYLDSSNFKKSGKSESNGTDFALQEIAVRFEQQFLGVMWNLAFRSDDREYEGGIGEELFSSELVGELVKQASANIDVRGNKIMGPIALDVYNEMKKNE